MKEKKEIAPDKVTKFEVKADALSGVNDTPKNGVINLPQRITSATVFAPKTAGLVINGVAVGHYANIVGVTGQMKSGKTAVNAAICAAAVTGGEFLGLAVPNAIGRNVVYFDTEQAGHDTQTNIYNRVCRLAGKTDIANFYVYNLRGLGIGDMLPVTDTIFSITTPGIAIVDGCADFVTSVNDEVKSHEIIAHFLHLAEAYNMLVVLVLHDNHNTEKSRGHLGSELDRKAEVVLTTQKESGTGIFTLKPKYLRNTGFIDHVQYMYNTDAGWFEFLQYTNPAGSKVNSRKAEAEQLAGICFADAGQLGYTELCNKIAKVDSCDFGAAKNRLRAWLKLGVISKTNDGFYFLITAEDAPF